MATSGATVQQSGTAESVATGWALTLSTADASSLAPFRLAAGLEIAAIGSRLWLRGPRAGDAFMDRLRSLPARERYEWVAPGQLRRHGSRIPCDRFPDARWESLAAWLEVRMPTAALPATVPRPVETRLVRSTTERPADILLTGWQEWAAWVFVAPRIRLQQLRFAVDDQRRVLVWGTPLPAIPGTRYVTRDSIAVPAGYEWEPAVEPGVMRRLFRIGADALVLWQADGRMVRLHREQFIAASAGAVRATAAGFNPEAA